MPAAVNDAGELELLTTPVFGRNRAASLETWGGSEYQGWEVNDKGELVVRPRWRIIAHQGGTRSSKTYSLAQHFAIQLFTRPSGYNVTLVRQSLPALKLTALRDFEAVLVDFGLNPDDFHHKQNKTYTFPNGNYLEYLSVLSEADGQKIRGAKRVDLWCNEANELSFEVWKQLIFRTTGQIFIDFNPSDEYHWIWDAVQTRDDAIFIKSSFLDNPFLPESVINEILLLQKADPNFWKVYGLGERGVSGASIYTHWQQVATYPEAGQEYLGLDFGFTHPTALVGTKVVAGSRYAIEYIYRAGLVTAELIALMGEIGISKQTPIFADAAAPAAILEISRHGYNIKAADKSVKDGIDEVKTKPLLVVGNSVNLISELKGYKYKVDIKTGRVLEEPVKVKDDAVDALRYAAYNSELITKVGIPITVFQSIRAKR